MGNFTIAINKTLKHEGGYVNDPEDTGAETYQGISRVHNPNWSGWKILDTLQPRHGQIYPQLTNAVIEYYKLHYWDAIKGDDICNDKVAAFLFDYFVNSGTHAIKAVQRIVGVTADGIIGNKTIQAINQHDGLFDKLKAERISFVRSLNKPRFINGWLNRIESFT